MHPRALAAHVKRTTLAPGNPIAAFGSQDASYQNLARLPGGSVGVITIGPRGHVGLHEAPVAQTVVVLTGAGFVSGRDGAQLAVGPRDVVEFERGEAHALVAGSDGMTVLVVEA